MLHRLLSEPVFRHKVFSFLSAAERYEQLIQEKLESQALTCKAANDLVLAPTLDGNELHLSVQIHPFEHPNFNQMFGNWVEFEKFLLNECETLQGFLEILKTRKETRLDAIKFLQDATRFEENVSQKFQESNG